MSESKEFPLTDVISAGSGMMVSNNGAAALYDVCNFMTSSDLFTHQLVRASKTIRQPLIDQHPFLEEVFKEAKQVTQENWQEWNKKWIAEHGEKITIKALEPGVYERMNPIAEMAEMRKGKPVDVALINTGE